MSEKTNIQLEATQQKLEHLDEKMSRYAAIREQAEKPYDRDLANEFVAKGFFENFYQWRAMRKGRKKHEAEYWHKGTERVFGEDGNNTAPSVRHAVATKISHLPSESILESASVNTARVLKGPDIEGETPMGKRWLRAKNLGGLLFGSADMRTYMQEKTSIKGGKNKIGNKRHRHTYKKARTADERFQRTGMVGDTIRHLRRQRLAKKIRRLQEAVSDSSDNES